jgi:hypothetical protein
MLKQAQCTDGVITRKELENEESSWHLGYSRRREDNCRFIPGGWDSIPG